jgi:type I restriction enzyme M protein
VRCAYAPASVHGSFFCPRVKANVLFFDRKPASEQAPTKKLWIYDLRTNMHFTLKTSPFDELVSRDKVSLDIFWLKDESLEASDNIPDPDVIAQDIVEDLEAALEQFREISGRSWGIWALKNLK